MYTNSTQAAYRVCLSKGLALTSDSRNKQVRDDDL